MVPEESGRPPREHQIPFYSVASISSVLKKERNCRVDTSFAELMADGD